MLNKIFSAFYYEDGGRWDDDINEQAIVTAENEQEARDLLAEKFGGTVGDKWLLEVVDPLIKKVTDINF